MGNEEDSFTILGLDEHYSSYTVNCFKGWTCDYYYHDLNLGPILPQAGVPTTQLRLKNKYTGTKK